MNAKRDQALEAIAMLIESSGITIDELQRHLEGQSPSTGVTLRAFVESETPLLPRDTRRTYLTSLQRLINGCPAQCECECDACLDIALGCGCECRKCARSKVRVEPLGDVALDAITYSQLDNSVRVAQRIARKRALVANRRRVAQGRAARPAHGKSAAETAIRAARWLLERARLDHHVESNPAKDLKVPNRDPSLRRSLTLDEFDELFDTIASGGDDPELDVLLAWFHIESGARREGAINLEGASLLDRDQMIRLDEKFGFRRDQPVSAELIAALRRFAISRGGDRCDPESPNYDSSLAIFWYRPRGSRPASPLTSRRYDTLFGRIQATLPWADTIAFTAHGLRYTAGTLVERLGGTQVARKFVGHADRSTTDLYTSAGPGEVAKAISKLTGTSHPLAPEPPEDADDDGDLGQSD